MDKSTRIGLGAAALFALVAIGEPLLPWWVSGPIMILCALVAIWGFWPLVTDTASGLVRLTPGQWLLLFSSLSIQRAARAAYETMEGTLFGAISNRFGNTAAERIDHHISAFLTRKYEMYGRLAPSTKLRRIPDDDMSLLKWAAGTNSLVSRYPAQPLRYDDVRISRKNLREYFAYLKRIGGLTF